MTTAHELNIIYRETTSLKTNPNNARTHSAAQIRKIANSIREFGFTNPILIDDTCTMVAGHGRAAAAKILGIDRLPTLQLEHLSPSQVRAYIIADNKLALEGGWDEDILKIEMQYLLLSPTWTSRPPDSR